jgi:hypothetical protein
MKLPPARLQDMLFDLTAALPSVYSIVVMYE